MHLSFKRLTPRVRLLILVAGVLFALLLVQYIIDNLHRRSPVTWGVTFSTKYAKELGIDWRAAFIASLDEVGVRAFRIPVYWNEVAPNREALDFADVDWMLEEAGKRQAKVILAIGRRVPRWPECHIPDWVNGLPVAEQEKALMDLLESEVNHFKKFAAVQVWQVENEPLFDAFGRCPKGDAALLSREGALVRSLDSTRPVMMTDSGELSSWLPTSLYSDILGISMYRVTWNKHFGYFYYPITPAFYRQHAALAFPFVNKVIVSELQTEPWLTDDQALTTAPFDEQFKSMSIDRFRNNIDFARRVGFSEVYLWGVEWWYWLKTKGEDSFWREAQAVFNTSK